MSKVGLMDKPVSQLTARSSVLGTDRIPIFTSTGTEPQMTTVDILMAAATGILDNDNVFTGSNSFTKPVKFDINTGITAYAGGGQSSATALTGQYNNVTTVASAYDSVALPTAVLGETIIIKNSGAEILSVFPATGDSINAMAVNLSVDIPVGGEMTFRAISATVWETRESLYLSAATTQTGGFEIVAQDNGGNYIVSLKNASHGQATSVIIPDGGAATSYLVQSTAALTLIEADILDGATISTTELNRLDDSAEVESITAAGAISDVKFNTNLNVASGGAVTLAACPATMVGKIKTIRMQTDDGDVTLALTNVQGGTAATTATFDDIGEELILIGSAGGKWTVIKEFGVTLT